MYEESLKAEIETEFGTKLTARQLWVLTKFAKHVRLRARSNAAFNNMANRVFPYARFSQVNKTRQDGTIYPGLDILVDGESAGVGEQEGE